MPTPPAQSLRGSTASGHERPHTPERSSITAQGSLSNDHAVGACLGDLHAGARYHHRQCVDPHHRRQSRGLGRSGHLDHHVVRRCQWGIGTADGLADASFRCCAHVRTVDSTVHSGVGSVRDCVESAGAACVPRAARCGVGPDDTRLTSVAIVAIPRREEGYCAGDLVDDHTGRANLRPDPGRLYLGQLSLGVDFPNQRSGRPLLLCDMLALPSPLRNADLQTVDRQSGPGAVDSVGRCAADHDGSGQGPGLVLQ